MSDSFLLEQFGLFIFFVFFSSLYSSIDITWELCYTFITLCCVNLLLNAIYSPLLLDQLPPVLIMLYYAAEAEFMHERLI